MEEARIEADRLRAAIRKHNFLYYIENRPEISDAGLRHAVSGPSGDRARVPRARHRRFPHPTRRRRARRLTSQRPAHRTHALSRLHQSRGRSCNASTSDFRRSWLRPSSTSWNRSWMARRSSWCTWTASWTGPLRVGTVSRGRASRKTYGTIRSVPLRLREVSRPAPALLAVRGEVLMFLSAFEELNRSLVEAGSEPFANPRNASAGALRQLDPRVTATRPLQFFAYDILSLEGATFETDEEAVQALRDWGLRLPERTRTVTGIDEAPGLSRRVRGGPESPRFRDRRRRGEGERPGPTGRAGKHLPPPPVGVRIQVRAPQGGHPSRAYSRAGRTDRQAHTRRAPQAR